MTGPVWDGTGVDPWLTERLEALTGFAVGERTIYDDYFARLSRWLVEVRRGVNANPAPDPTVVFAHQPAWEASMDEFVDQSVWGQMSSSYEEVFGSGFQFDQRPAVATYLSDVRNRMVRTTDDVYGLIAGQIAEGSGLGESIPDLAARVDEVLSATGAERWANRATVVARTEAIGAANMARWDSQLAMVEELGDDDFEHQWLATVDDRTRPSHVAADGQRVPVGESFVVGGHELRFPGDPKGPADEVIQCRCSVLLVRKGENVDMSDRQFLADQRTDGVGIGKNLSGEDALPWDQIVPELEMGPDKALSAIYKAQGFDGLPQLGTAAEVDEVIAAGGRELFRGVTEPGFVDAFKSGSYYPGTGIHGNGTYTSTLESTAGAYTSSLGNIAGNKGTVMRMALKPGARVLTKDEYKRQHDAATKSMKIGSMTDREITLADPGRWAAASGYDAYQASVRTREEYWVVLNRTALIVER